MPSGYVYFATSYRETDTLVEYHILREASADLLVQQWWAIPGPQNVGRATSTDSHAFLYNY